MKFSRVSVVRAVAAGAVVSILSAGCVSSSSDRKPGEITPRRGGPKTVDNYTPIDANVVPTPTPHSMPKKRSKRTAKLAIPVDTASDVNFTLSEIPSGFSLPLTVKVRAWQVQIIDDGDWYATENVEGPLAIFTGTGSAYKNITFTTVPQTISVSVTVPSSRSGQQFFIGTSKLVTQGETDYTFGSGQIFVATD